MVDSPVKRPYAIIVVSSDYVYDAIDEYLENAHEDYHPEDTIYRKGNFMPREKTLGEIEIVLVYAENDNNSIAQETERAIQHYKPTVAFFVGTASGLNKIVLGDVVTASKVYYFESGKAGENFLVSPQGYELPYGISRRIRIEARNARKNPTWLQQLKEPPARLPTVHYAPVLSGAKELDLSAGTIPGTASEKLRTFLEQYYNGSIAIEQGSYGFLKNMHAREDRIQAAVILGITNTISATPSQMEDRETLEQIAARNASAFTFEVLEKWISQNSTPPDRNGAIPPDLPPPEANLHREIATPPPSDIGLHSKEREALAPREAFLNAYGYGVPVQRPPTNNSQRDNYLRNFIRVRQHDRQRSGVDLVLEDIYIEPDLTDRPRKRNGDRLTADLPRKKIYAQNPRMRYPEEKKPRTFEGILNKALHEKWTYLVITGEAGYGKTTLLNMVGIHCAHQALADDRCPVPIFIELAEFAKYIKKREDREDTQSRLEEYLVSHLESSSRAEVSNAFREGKYLLLLDGLDEIHDEIYNQNLSTSVKNIVKHVSEHSACNIIITSRGASYDGQFNWPIYELIPFSESQIISYTEKSIQESPQLQELLEVLRDDERKHLFLSLLSTPLTLAMMVHMLETAGQNEGKPDIPQERVRLYDQYIEQSMKRLRNYWSIVFPRVNAEHILIHIAHRLHSTGKYYEKKEDIVKYMQEVLPGHDNYEKLLKDIDEETGLLRPGAPNFYRFQHLTFQEYFAARYQEKNEGGQQFLLMTSINPWWHEVTTIYYALTGDQTFIEQLLEAGNGADEITFAIRAQLAADCLRTASASVENTPLENRVYEQLKQRYYTASCSAFKACLFDAIKRLGENVFWRFLQEVYREEEESWSEVLPALSRFKSNREAIADMLNGWYRSSEDAYKRREIIATLVQIEDDIPSLLFNSFREDPNYADQIVELIIDTLEQNDSYLSRLFSLALSPGISKEIQHSILAQLGASRLPLIQSRFKDQLHEAITAQRFPLIISLLETIRFPIHDTELQSRVQSLIRPYPTMTIPMLLACIEFLGHQALYEEQQELDDTLLFILSDDTISVDRSDVALTSYYHANDRERVHQAIITLLIQLDNQAAFEYIHEYLHGADATITLAEFSALAGEYGKATCFSFLAAEMEKTFEQDFPAEESDALLLALYEINKRLVDSRVDPAVNVSARLYQWLQHSFQTIDLDATDQTIIEAYLFLLFYHGDSAQRAEIYRRARRHTRLGDILAGALRGDILTGTLGEHAPSHPLDAEQSGIPQERHHHSDKRYDNDTENFIQYYIGDRPSSWFTYELERKFLASSPERRRAILREALGKLDPEECLYALDFAEQTFEAESNELTESLKLLLNVADERVVDKAITVMGKLGGRDGEPTLQRYLNREPFENSAFAALFQLRHRLS